MKPKIIAFYLPQYHPTPSNDIWWGEGFTEWTNVAKAKPLFPGHYQPKIPANLGFYDLRQPETRQRQAELAKEAGITGFCYYHYWFGNGHQELELPFNQVLASGKPDFPFCICWANETWARKMWNADGAVVKQKILAEQKYLGYEDDVAHFYELLPAFKDHRYIRVNDKPLFMIYNPSVFKNISSFIKTWGSLAKSNGIKGIHFVGYTYNIDAEKQFILDSGFDAICCCRLNRNRIKNFGWTIRKAWSTITHSPRRYPYKKAIKTFIKEDEKTPNIYPTLIPNWDHTARSGVKGDLLTNSTPVLFEKHAEQAMRVISNKPQEDQICFLKSWNEWGEGNYMEPDLRFGKGYIEALRKAINTVFNK